MTKAEFKSAFHTEWNNINSNMAPGILDAELSQFATKAYWSIVKGLYDGTLSGFESSEETRVFLDSLVKQDSMTALTNSSLKHIVSGSKLFKAPTDLMFVVFESATISESGNSCVSGKQVVVKPVTHDQFWNAYNNPFRGSNDRRILRLTHTDSYTEDNTAVECEVYELVTKHTVDSYDVRYVAQPEVIGSTFTSTTEQICKLPKILHPTLVEYTVDCAKQVWS